MKYLVRSLISCIISILFISHASQAQLLADQKALDLVQKGIDHIYNLEFREASAVLQQVRSAYPNHPVTYLLKAQQMYWQYLPIKDSKAKVGEYIQTLNQGLASTEKLFGKNSKNPEAVFYTMVARGYLALMHNYEGELLSAAGEAQKAYNALTTGMKLLEKNPEFYFTTGMYNYYIELYPEDHPIVKPVMLFFKKGDKALGLKQIDIASKKAVITRVEASYYLSHIYLEHESRPDKALPYIARLANQYPENPIFAMMHIETLILCGHYKEAKSGMDRILKMNEGFYPIARYVFEGMLLEKADQDYNEAEKQYLSALKIPHDSQYTREYHAMAYAGLARIAHRENKKALARNYYKKCLEKAEYKSIIKEAKAYLK